MMTHCSEIWKDIPDYEGYYMVSNLGRVKSCDRYLRAVYDSVQLKKGQIIKPQKTHNGYYTVGLYNNGKIVRKYVHRLVALVFLPNPSPAFTQINHKDEDKSNNRVDNLEWCDNKYNINYGGARERISRSHLLLSYCSIPVVQCDLLGNELRSFRSASDASKVTGIDASAIRKVCLGRPKFKTAGGYIWKSI